MESGLKKAETNEHEPKLFKVAGGVRPVMTEVSRYKKQSQLAQFLCLKGSNGLGTKSEIHQYDQGSIGLVVNEPRGRVRVGLREENLCLERI